MRNNASQITCWDREHSIQEPTVEAAMFSIYSSTLHSFVNYMFSSVNGLHGNFRFSKEFLFLFINLARKASRSTIMSVPYQDRHKQSGASFVGLLSRTSFNERVLLTLGFLAAVVAGTGVVSHDLISCQNFH